MLPFPALAATEPMNEARYRNGKYEATLGEMAGRRLYVYGIVDSFVELADEATDANLALNAEEPAGRLDAALYLYRMLGSNPTGDCPFTDVPAPYLDAVTWLYEAGVTKGIGHNQYGTGYITEHQLLVMLSRYFHWESEHPDAVRYLAESIELLPLGPDDGVFTYGDLYQILANALDKLCPERRVAVRPEMSAPDSVQITAESCADALKQIDAALDYVPESIAIRFSEDCPDEKVTAFAQLFEQGGAALPARLIGCIDWNAFVPYHLTKYRGNRFRLWLPHYTPVVVSSADLLDWLRVYRDEAYSAALAEFAGEYLEPLKRLPTNFDKAKSAHDLLCRMASYDYAALNNGMKPEAHSLLGFINNRRVVCDGYAKTYQWMLRYLGIDSYVVSGTTSRGAHGWNKVYLDGAWYNVDVCWDDGDGYRYFLKSDAFFTANGHIFTDAFSASAFASPSNYQR